MWTFTVGHNGGVSPALLDSIMDVLADAADYWGRYINFGSAATLDIEINFISLDDDVLAQAGPDFIFDRVGPGGEDVYQAGTILELQTGTDPNGAAPDIYIDVNLDTLLAGEYHLGGIADAGVASNEYDLFTVLLHEIGHGLGFASFYGDPSGDITEYDLLLTQTNGVFFFTGSKAKSVYNGDVQLGDDPSHFNRRIDLFNSGLEPGDRLVISELDAAILEDVGLLVLAPTTDDDTLFGFESRSQSGLGYTGGRDNVDLLDGDDFFYGLSGDDTINGNSGDDTLEGGRGADQLIGGSGEDTASYRSSGEFLSGVLVNLDTGDTSGYHALGDTFSSIENIIGGPYNDTLIGDASSNRLFGEAGTDELRGGLGQDILSGDTDPDFLYGDEGDDLLNGGSGNDFLAGGPDSDSLTGGEGDDHLNGGVGADTLFGGSGRDIFFFASGGSQDVVEDFSTRVIDGDFIEFDVSTSPFSAVQEILDAATQNEDDVIIDLGGGDALTLLNIQLTDLNSYDFRLLDDLDPQIRSNNKTISFSYIDANGFRPIHFGLNVTIEPTGGIENITFNTYGEIVRLNTESFVVNKGTVAGAAHSVGGENAGIYGIESYRGEFVNEGTILLEGHGSTLLAGSVVQKDGDFTNLGLIKIIQTGLNEPDSRATGIASAQQTVTNGGEIIIISDSSAAGIRAGNRASVVHNTGEIDISVVENQISAGAVGISSEAFRVTNDGTISAVADAGSAIGIIGEGSGSVENSGAVTAIGAGAIAIDADYQSVIVNSGDLYAEELQPGGVSIGVLFDSRIFGGITRIENTGSIVADHAISANENGVQELYNSGLIQGDIFLGGREDRIDNTDGVINGDVDFGSGDDFLDNSLGDINGVVYGGRGLDTLIGGIGADTISGGGSDDTIDGGAGDDAISGEAGRDSVFGGDGADTLHGFGSHDTLIGGGDNDDLRGGFGRDLLGGANGDDVGRGYQGDDRLFGGGGADTLLGNDGDDSLTGGGGIDRLKGDAGDDTLNGRFGADSVTGGAGDDLFQFRQGHGDDIYDDFTPGAGTDDVIQLVALGAAFDTFAEVIGAASDDGAHTTIDFGGGNTILLLNVTKAELHEDDFIFT